MPNFHCLAMQIGPIPALCDFENLPVLSSHHGTEMYCMSFMSNQNDLDFGYSQRRILVQSLG